MRTSIISVTIWYGLVFIFSNFLEDNFFTWILNSWWTVLVLMTIYLGVWLFGSKIKKDNIDLEIKEIKGEIEK